jgi:hypothetical protein
MESDLRPAGPTDAGPEPRVRVLLRREVGALRTRESRRVFDPAVSIGVLSGERDSFTVRAQDSPVVDDALRTDIWSRLLEKAEPGWRTAWLTRTGGPEEYATDAAWLSTAIRAFAVHGRPLDGFFVLTRYGWRDVRTGAAMEWRRLRV